MLLLQQFRQEPHAYITIGTCKKYFHWKDLISFNFNQAYRSGLLSWALQVVNGGWRIIGLIIHQFSEELLNGHGI